MGFGPLGTSWASAPNSLFEGLFLGCLGCKFAVDLADAEGSKRTLLTGADEEAMDGLFMGLDKLMRRRKMKRMEIKRTKGCDDFVWISEIDDDDDVFGTAMQFGKRNHPPRAHKGSKSMNQLQG